MSRTGATRESYKNIFEGPGVLYMNFKSFVDKGTLIGATRGGVNVNFNNALRGIDFDGSQGQTKGLVVKDKQNPEIQVTVLELTKEKLDKYIAGSNLDGNSLTGRRIKLDDYIENVTWVGLRNDGTTFCVIQLFNVLFETGSLATADNEEGTLEITARGHYEIGQFFETEDCYPLEPWKLNIGEPLLDELTESLTALDGTYAALVEADNGYLYAIPKDAANITKYNPVTEDKSTFAHGLTGTDLFSCAIKSKINGKIYCIPKDYTSVLVIDPADDSTEELAISGLTGGDYYGAVAESDNGTIFAAPLNAEHVLTILPLNNEINTTTIAGLTGANKYASATNAAGEGKIYCAPFDADNVLIIDTVAKTADTTTISVDAGNSKYKGSAQGLNGKIYCAPNKAENVLIINPKTNQIDIELMDEIATSATDDIKYSKAVLAKNGKIYLCPQNDDNVGVIDSMVNKLYEDIITKDYEDAFGIDMTAYSVTGNLYGISQVSGDNSIWEIK